MDKQSTILNRLRQTGHRVTPQRVMILEALEAHPGHVSAEDVFQHIQVQHPYVNRSTVYRTLDLLSKEGVVTTTDLGKGSVRYELHSDEPHHHLVCQGCGQVEAFDHALLEPLQAALEREYKFHARIEHFAVFGLCAVCSAKQAKPKPIHKPTA